MPTPTVHTAEQRVALLLAFLPDVLPAARGGKPWAERGEAPSRRITCPDCEGKGRITWRVRGIPKSRECPRCGRRGWVEIDNYTLRDVQTAEADAEPATKRVTCDSCGGEGVHRNGRRCRYCGGEGYHTVAAVVSEPVGGEHRARPGDHLRIACAAGGASAPASLYARGSFRELQRALTRLPPWRRFLLKQPGPLPERQLADQRGSLRMLTVEVLRETGGTIRVPRELLAWAAADSAVERRRYLTRGERNAEIRRRRLEGQATGRIARELGVSRRTVQRQA